MANVENTNLLDWGCAPQFWIPFRCFTVMMHSLESFGIFASKKIPGIFYRMVTNKYGLVPHKIYFSRFQLCGTVMPKIDKKENQTTFFLDDGTANALLCTTFSHDELLPNMCAIVTGKLYELKHGEKRLNVESIVALSNWNLESLWRTQTCALLFA